MLTFYVLEQHWFPTTAHPLDLGHLGCAVRCLGRCCFPGAPLHVNASPWLPLHWALGIASYGLFAAAVVHAMMRRAEKNMRHATDTTEGLPLLTLERLTFRFVGAGFVLLTATLWAGLVVWRQLVWSGQHGLALGPQNRVLVLSWVVFAILLVGRYRFGWRGRKAVRFLYVGSGLLLLGLCGFALCVGSDLGTHTHEIP